MSLVEWHDLHTPLISRTCDFSPVETILATTYTDSRWSTVENRDDIPPMLIGVIVTVKRS